MLNRDDSRLATLQLPVPVRTFGTHPSLRALFPADDDLYAAQARDDSPRLSADDTSLLRLDGQTATMSYGGKETTVQLKINGIYNVLNAVAALALCRMVMGDDADEPKLLQRLASITPAFDRGESFTVHGQPLELILVKNPAGFRLSLASFPAEGHAIMMAVNDQYADGRDMSWLWDVDFMALQPHGVQMVSGVRAYDMALRLQYDEVPIVDVDTKLTRALRKFIAEHPDKPKRIFCTYTAMLAIRRDITKLTKNDKAV